MPRETVKEREQHEVEMVTSGKRVIEARMDTRERGYTLLYVNWHVKLSWHLNSDSDVFGFHIKFR